MRAIMQHPAHTAGSDGILVGEQPHPRGWGTFARYLAVYVRELGVLSLPECIRHMTSLPAQRLGLADRGLVRPGMAADIAVFDPAAVRDMATYERAAAARRGLPARGRERRARARRRRPHGRHAGPAAAPQRRLSTLPDSSASRRPPGRAPRGRGRARSGAPSRSGRSRRGRRPMSRASPQLRGEVLGRVAVGRHRPQRGDERGVRRRARGRRRGRARRARGRRRRRSRRSRRPARAQAAMSMPTRQAIEGAASPSGGPVA